MVLEGPLQATKGKSKQVPSYKPSVYNGELPAYTLGQCWHESSVNSQFTI